MVPKKPTPLRGKIPRCDHRPDPLGHIAFLVLLAVWSGGDAHAAPPLFLGLPHRVPDMSSSAAPDDADIDVDRARQLAEEVAEVRRQLASVPAEQVVSNHAMGLFELAAIHLQQVPPRLADAALAIDAMGAIVEGVGPERLGDAGSTLEDALNQIRLAFVQVKGINAAAS
jgi:hypothetical protein